MRQNKKFAVTGGIGSGKSTVLGMLRARGFAVFSCDAISDELWGEEAYLRGLSELFPACVREGKPDRRLLAEIVFSDKAALARLDAYSHPRIMEALMSRMTEPVCFAEVPLLFEGGYETLFDGIIVVTRREEARIAAVSLRDGLGEKAVRARMQAQLSDREREEKAGCFILENDGDLAALEGRLETLLKKILH